MRLITVVICLLLTIGVSGCTLKSETPSERFSSEIPSAVVSEKPSDSPVSEAPPVVTAVQLAFEEAQHISESELQIAPSGNYSYKTFNFSPETLSVVNGEIVVSQGAIYDEMSWAMEMALSAGYIHSDWLETLIGTSEQPENWTEIKTEIYELIHPEATEQDILKVLEGLDCVSGDFNYETRTYDFTISDLSGAASDLHISQEMLGYTLAKISEYTDNITFDGNTVSCSFEVWTKPVG